MTNEMLRSHVTGAAFHLTLGKTHIAALVHLEEVLAFEETHGLVVSRRGGPRSTYLGNFTTGASGLIARGLVTHTDPYPPNTCLVDKPFAEFWQITPAGRLVLQLLREAGIWQEYATNPVADEVAA